MRIVGVNWGMACSSLLLGDLSYDPYVNRSSPTQPRRYYKNDEERMEAFFRQFESAVEEAQRPTNKVYVGRPDDSGGFVQVLKGHEVDTFAFLVASTRPSLQPEICWAFEKLGFHSTDLTYNSKNGTEVKFWMIEMPKLWKHYEKYLEEKAEKEMGE